MSIDVRRSVWLGEPVKDGRCLTCGECIQRCPRGLLRFEQIGGDGNRTPAPAGQRMQTATPARPRAGRRYVVVGSGPASAKACDTIRAADPWAEISVIAREPEAYYSRPGLAYYLAGEVSEDGLFPLNRQAPVHAGARFINGIVREIRPAEHQVVVEGGQRVAYDRLLLATGSTAIIPPVTGVDLDGVVKLDNLEDAREIISRSRRAKVAVVVGGGITALEIVEGLAARRVKVHYFMRKDRYWSDVLAEAESRIVEQSLRRCGVVMHYFTELGAVLGRGGRVTGVETTTGETIPCQMVGLAIGVTPRKGLAEEAGLECRRGVMVDGYLRSSDPDIFVAGDLAEIPEAAGGRSTMDVLWSSAVEKGRVAGHNMALMPDGADVLPAAAAPGAAAAPEAGAEAPPPGRTPPVPRAAAPPAGGPMLYRKALALNVTRLAGHRVTIMGRVGKGDDADLKGIARGDSETWRRMGEATTVVSSSRDAHLRLALEDDVIVGALVMGDQQVSFLLQDLVASQRPLGGLKDRLLAPGADLALLLEQAWRHNGGRRG
jgi:NAD(P)H-nitrite reductase large subunit